MQSADTSPDGNVFAFTLQDRIFNADLAAAKVPKRGACGRAASFHSLRKSFAYGLVRSGVDVNVARQLLQHETIEMTLKVYDEARSDDLLKGLQKMWTPSICSGVNGLRAMADAVYGATGGKSQSNVLTGDGRSDRVCHLVPSTPDTSTPPGPLAFAKEQGPARFDGPRGDGVLLERLAAALDSREGRSDRPSEAQTPDQEVPRGGLEPPFTQRGRGGWADELAGVLEAVARLIRSGSALGHLPRTEPTHTG